MKLIKELKSHSPEMRAMIIGFGLLMSLELIVMFGMILSMFSMMSVNHVIHEQYQPICSDLGYEKSMITFPNTSVLFLTKSRLENYTVTCERTITETLIIFEGE